MACRNCSRDHAPVSLAEWSWTVRDITHHTEAAWRLPRRALDAGITHGRQDRLRVRLA